jgi:hypothetical protein
VSPTDTGTAPSAKVSIMTVNGDLDPALETSNFPDSGIDLSVMDASSTQTLMVPLSMVDSINERPAPRDGYRPSVLTPEAREPTSPLNVTGVARNGAVVVSWSAPANDGGSAITEYVVTSSPGSASCTTSGQLTCAITGLTNNTNYTFTVVATNALGTSSPSTASSTVRPTSSSPTLTAPTAPPSVMVTGATALPVPNVSRYSDTFTVTWGAEPSANAAPVIDYLVTIRDLATLQERTCTTTGELTCTVTGFAPPDPLLLPVPYLPTFSVTVTAHNAIGNTSSTLPTVSLALPPAEVYTPPVVPPHPGYTPLPVVDITSATANDVTVFVPGYVSTPQGVVRVAVGTGGDASKMSVKLDGGVLAAWIDLSATRPADFSMGMSNPSTQRIIRIVTDLTDGSDITSDAIVQINETGGWAVNSWVVQ